MIQLFNISKSYQMGENTIKALDDISLQISEGEFLAIIGPSGSGKSTLMKIYLEYLIRRRLVSTISIKGI